MFIVVEAGLPTPRPFAPRMYDQDGILKLAQLVNTASDPRVLQSVIREYLDSVSRHDPSKLELYFTMPQNINPLMPKILRYENMRLILQEMSYLLSAMSDVCNSTNCPTMLATAEWKFLCTVHSTEPQDCCAMSYSCHLLDAGEPSFVKSCSADFLYPTNKQMVLDAQKTYSFLERRSYRILAHAYFHHKEIFTAFESSRYLYRRFLKYLNLWAPKQPANLVPFIPPESFAPWKPVAN